MTKFPPPAPPRCVLMSCCWVMSLSGSPTVWYNNREELSLTHWQGGKRQRREEGGSERGRKRRRMWLINRKWCSVWKSLRLPARCRLYLRLFFLFSSSSWNSLKVMVTGGKEWRAVLNLRLPEPVFLESLLARRQHCGVRRSGAAAAICTDVASSRGDLVARACGRMTGLSKRSDVNNRCGTGVKFDLWRTRGAFCLTELNSK